MPARAKNPSGWFMSLRDIGLFARSARSDATIERIRAAQGARHAFETVYGDSGDPWAAGSAVYRYQRHKYETIISLLPPRRFANALDLGCGLGMLTQRLASVADQVLGLDIAENALVNARDRARHLTNVRFEQADLLALDPSLAGRFDLVVVADVIYYVSPLGDALLANLAEQIAGLLTPGGLCVLVNHSLFVADPGSRLTRRIHSAFGSSPRLRLTAQYRRPFYLVSFLTSTS